METFSIITFVAGLLVGAGISLIIIACFFYWLFSQSE
jgi:hypothetical protein|tara:strand:- start:1106 stop:1216 length:111 start_codon:yes stop_codon:yes gene_type:complete